MDPRENDPKWHEAVRTVLLLGARGLEKGEAWPAVPVAHIGWGAQAWSRMDAVR